MRYIFKILIMSGNPDVIQFYALRAFGENGEDKGTYSEWYKEIRVLEDICDLEIDVLSSISADLDDLLSKVDGIIYFLNPLIEEESELFEMILPDIFSVKHDIPTIITLYDQNGILPFSSNELLEHIWVNFPSLEAFVNLPPTDFHQILQSLSLAMINGDTPLNIENAWMRFPIFIQMANIYYANKNYYYAAQAIKKAALIAEIYNKEEFFIICEQAAYVYSKINLYLEASKILENIDYNKSVNFKNLYAEAIIREGNQHFNRKEFEKAAKLYEQAAQFSSIESLDITLIHAAFRLAINSWISCCNVEKAFRILDALPHKGVISILKEVTGKIGAAADFLVSDSNFESAREQLYIAIDKYQREGLFDELKELTFKLTEILTQILRKFINEKNIYAAKNTFDELENMWESYKVKKTDLDSTLEQLIKFLLDDNNFGMASVLISKLNSRHLRQKLTKVKDEFEEKYTSLKKKEITDYLNKGIDFLREFVEAERDLIIEMNTQKINEAEELSKQNEYLKAANQLKNQAEYLKKIGKEEIQDQILTKSLDLLLKGLVFETFFEIFDELSNDMKMKYLIRVFQFFLQQLKEFMKIDDFERKEVIIENSNKIFRNQMLYDESKEISLIFISNIKKEALKILASEENITGINKATDLVKKISKISSAYLEREERSKITFNKIFKKIAEIYIILDDLSSANAYNDRIENKTYKNEIHKKIEKLESEKSAFASKKAEESYKGEILKEKLSIIKNKGRESLLDKTKELKARNAMKRVYFKDALSKIELQEYNKSYILYKKSISQLNKLQKYNLAGVSLAMASFLLIKENRFDEIKSLLAQTKNTLSSLGKLFSETFPVTLIEYIIELKKFQDESKIKEALTFFENLPLFEEERIILYKYLSKDYVKAKESKKNSEKIVNIEEIKMEILNLANSLQKEKQDIAKRKLMKKEYWRLILEDINKSKMADASLAYFNSLPILIKKKFLKYAAINLIIGSVILLKEKNIQIATETFKSHLKDNDSKLENLPEIQSMNFLLIAIKNNEKELIDLIINLFLKKLILFEPEIKILNSLLGEEIIEELNDKEEISRKEIGDFSKLQLELDQNFGKIQSKMVDIKSDREGFLKKRRAMRKRYYSDILDLLKSKNYKKVAVKYSELAKIISKRKDLETSSLLMLLHGLSLFKAEESIEIIKDSINKFLDSLRMNKKLVKETFYIMVILFLVDVKLNNLNMYSLKIKEFLEILPLFEEEKELLEIE